MNEIFARVWDDLIGRVSGPMKFRLVLQSMMAIIFAGRSAIKDACEENPPYFRALFTCPKESAHSVQREPLIAAGAPLDFVPEATGK